MSRQGRLLDTRAAARWLTAAVVWFGVFVTHWRSPICCEGGDPMWTVHTALSILREGNTNLDEYGDLMQNPLDYGYSIEYAYTLEEIGDHVYTWYPIGTSLIALPFVLVMDQACGRVLSLDFDHYLRHIGPGPVQRFIASFVVALTAVLIYLIARLSLPEKYSLLLVFVFAFCTCSWSTASRALWQHGPSMLMLSATVYLILLAEEKPSVVQLASIPLVYSFTVRPTNIISVVVLTIFVLVHHRRQLPRFVVWGMAIAIPFLLVNLAVYHSLLPPYYVPARMGSSKYLFEALAGNLISPARGLFMFSPVLLLALYGMTLRIWRDRARKVDYFFAAIVILHWMAISRYGHWWGGYSYGPRLFSDMIPYFCYFLIPVLARVSEFRGARKHIAGGLLLGLVAASFFVHYRGATSWDVHDWNKYPVSVDMYPERLWDWRDIQFLRGIEF